MSELYELVKKTEALCSALPEVVDRLVSLEGLHEQGELCNSLQPQDTHGFVSHGKLCFNSCISLSLVYCNLFKDGYHLESNGVDNFLWIKVSTCAMQFQRLSCHT